MTRPSCEIPGCGRPHRARGYCGAHYVRMTPHGHPQADLPVEAKTVGGIGYWACHERVKAQRGPASAQPCAECGVPATDWSYDGTGKDGSAVKMSGSTSDVLRRSADGVWRYVIDNPFGTAIGGNALRL